MVTKRDGSKVPFDKNKIVVAIEKAYWGERYPSDLSDPPFIQQIADYIADEYEAYELTIDDIQELVENQLMKHEPNTAREYIRYRYKRDSIRQYKDAFLRSLKSKIEATDVQNQNANVDEHSFGGRRGETDSEVMRQYALNYCMSKKARDNHLNNRIYIHDLDSYAVGMHNCLTVPFDDLLANGFNTRQTDVRPARSINTAFQLIAVIFQLQSL